VKRRLRRVVPGKLAVFGRVFGDPGLAPSTTGSEDAEESFSETPTGWAPVLADASFRPVST
jgi:hypothetical protein